MLSISKITSKYQASIPAKVRGLLNIKAGDYLEFDQVGNDIIIKKANSFDKNLLKLMEQSLQEWNSKEDDDKFSYLKNFIK